MSTQDKSPVANLMSDLGIDSEISTPNTDENSNNQMTNNLISDSDTPTQTDGNKSETSVDTDPSANAGDTGTIDELAVLKAELEKANKRISDKDRYINELQQGKQKNEDASSGEVDYEEESSDFWDDPEGNYKNIQNQLKIANLRIDEAAYAMRNTDYYDVVKTDVLDSALAQNPEFLDEFRNSTAPYEVAYRFLKADIETKHNNEVSFKQKLKDEARAEILAEYGLDKDTPKKQVPPSMRSLGSASGRDNGKEPDGFTAMFGGM